MWSFFDPIFNQIYFRLLKFSVCFFQHSPESPSLCRDSLSGRDLNGHGTTSPSYDSSSRSSFHNENVTSKNKRCEENSDDLSAVCKEVSVKLLR